MTLSAILPNCLREKADARFFVVMHSLLYPGVLGSVMYALPDSLVSLQLNPTLASTDPTLVQSLVAVAFFIVFTMDYTHSVTIPNKRAYTVGTFAADIAIVLLLFFAGQQILHPSFLPSVKTEYLLGFAKLFSMAWEGFRVPITGTPDNTSEPEKEQRAALETDCLFMIFYWFIGLIGWLLAWNAEVSKCILAVVLLIDSAYYLVYYQPPRKAATS